MVRRFRLLTPLLILLAGAGPATADEAALQRRLATLIDQPTPAARAKLADALAADRSVELAAWRKAMAAFGSFRPCGTGVRHETDDLQVGDEVQAVTISTYVPPSYDPQTPAPLLLVLHGSGHGGHELPAGWQSVADALGMVVIAPTDRLGMGGWTKTAPERQLVWAALRWARRQFNVDERRIHCTGASRGGHLAWDLALRHPDRFASISPMLGGPLVSLRGGLNNLRFVEHLADLPIRDLQGAQDDPILVANVRLTFARLKVYGAGRAKLVEFPRLGHAFDIDAVDWEAFLGEARREAVPRRVLRRTVHVKGERAGEGRAAWVEILETKKPSRETFRLSVSPRVWSALSPDERREALAVEAEKHTARLEAKTVGPGRFEVKTTAVKRLRLLLDPDMFPADARIEVTLDGRTRKLKVKPSKAVLLREFAERFDRTFLPVVEVVLKP